MSATDELAEVEAGARAAVAARRQVDAQEREAYDGMRVAEGELEGLLAQKMGGDEPPAKLMSDAQKRLDRAREGTRREWALERKAADRVVLQREGDRQRFIAERFDDLLSEAHARADQAASAVDAAARALIEAIDRRTAVESELVGLVHVARMGDEWLVRRARSDQLRQAAERLLAQREAPPRYEPLRPAVAIGEPA